MGLGGRVRREKRARMRSTAWRNVMAELRCERNIR